MSGGSENLPLWRSDRNARIPGSALLTLPKFLIILLLERE